MRRARGAQGAWSAVLHDRPWLRHKAFRAKVVGCEVRVSVNTVSELVSRSCASTSAAPALRRLSLAGAAQHQPTCAATRAALAVAGVQPSAGEEDRARSRGLVRQKYMCTVMGAKKLFLAVRQTARNFRCMLPAAETLSPQDPKLAPPDYQLTEEDSWNIKPITTPAS